MASHLDQKWLDAASADWPEKWFQLSTGIWIMNDCLQQGLALHTVRAKETYRKAHNVKVRKVWPHWQRQKASQHIQRVGEFKAKAEALSCEPGLGFENSRYKWAAPTCKQRQLLDQSDWCAQTSLLDDTYQYSFLTTTRRGRYKVVNKIARIYATRRYARTNSTVIGDSKMVRAVKHRCRCMASFTGGSKLRPRHDSWQFHRPYKTTTRSPRACKQFVLSLGQADAKL